VLTKARLADLARDVEVTVSVGATKDALAEALVASSAVRFRDVVGRLGRDELRAACRAHGLDDASRSRPALMARLLEAHGAADSIPPAPMFGGAAAVREVPVAGNIVRCRLRQWVVEGVAPPAKYGDASLVSLVCLDDDHQGRRLEVLWELELGANILQPEAHGLGVARQIDPPRHFAAVLHALRWSSVTATDARLFQAPFRAGIQLLAHQLTPLKKALQLPRANLFIADDVGLGKTIEAGLVLQELLLRQRVELVLIVCPPSVALQWRDEMAVRFGLHFELYNRAFVARRRQERGFGCNPWSTHSRFIVSYQTLRRPEHQEPLLQHLGERASRSLLILDEAHTVAPASPGRYAIDSRLTKVAKALTPLFENRLFLSATPHNGHSNSFSALLEMLDPQRFTRAVEVQAKAREEVMVRRLKEDLRALKVATFPKREIVRIALPGTPPEVRLSQLLAEYTALMKPARGRGTLVFVNLQKRLLSSIEAFVRTLELHAEAVLEGRAKAQLDLSARTLGESRSSSPDTLPLAWETERAPTNEAAPDLDDDVYGADDDALDAEDAHAAALSSRAVETPAGRARQLLDEMLRLAREQRAQPDAKALALLDWIREHQCPAAKAGGPTKGPKSARAWTDRRVLVFTEYGDTKKWVRRIVSAAIDGTDRADERIMDFHGGMSDDQRAEVQEAFNGDPAEHPVRILLATDAAREGVNLQGHCADLFHFDVPWNPARLEQRNGRIDRTLQPAPEVRCHYFAYSERTEDAVLETLVHKVEVIRKELGSLGSVLMERLDGVLARGIDGRTAADLDAAEDVKALRETAREEAEVERADLKKLKAEIDEASRILDASAKVMEFDPPLLRDAIDVGLELAGIPGRLTPAPGHEDAWALPAMPESWEPTLDALRSPRGRDESLWDWRARPLPPVTFTAGKELGDRRVHLHLSHPLVQRVMDRLRAQGTANDLSRVTAVPSRKDHVARAIAFGRLTLFGPGATRLHDELVAVASGWLEAKGEGHLEPLSATDQARLLERLESLFAETPTLDPISAKTRERLRASSAADFATLWRHVEIEADARAHDAEDKLRTRARAESAALLKILDTQRAHIEKALKRRAQQELPFGPAEREAKQQWQDETAHLETRLAAAAKERDTEPAAVEALYQVALKRLEPVGLVYVWPQTKG